MLPLFLNFMLGRFGCMIDKLFDMYTTIFSSLNLAYQWEKRVDTLLKELKLEFNNSLAIM